MPRYKTDRYASFLPINTKAIQDFLIDDTEIVTTLKNHESYLIMFFKCIPETPYNDLSLQDVKKILKNVPWKQTLKEVIKWSFGSSLKPVVFLEIFYKS